MAETETEFDGFDDMADKAEATDDGPEDGGCPTISCRAESKLLLSMFESGVLTLAPPPPTACPFDLALAAAACAAAAANVIASAENLEEAN